MGNYVHIAEDADNSSILVLGRSGSGKTYALQQIEKNIAEGGGMVLVLNFNSTHDFLNYGENQKVKRINIRAEGYPFPLFCPMIFPDGRREREEDIVESILEIFGGVLPLPVRQKAELRMAVQQVVEHPEMWAQGIQAIRDLLMQREEEAAWRVYDKFYSLFSSVEFRQQEEKIFSSGQITILDLGDYTANVQHFIAEMTLAILYRYFCIWGRYGNKKANYDDFSRKRRNVKMKKTKEDANIRVYTKSDLLEIFPFGRTKLQQLLTAGVLPVVKVGKSYLTSEAQIQRWLLENTGKEIFY